MQDWAVVYALVDPTSKLYRYVGWTVNPERRLVAHLKEAAGGGTSHKCRWIQSLTRQGFAPEIRVLETCQRAGVRSREIWWAAQFENLTNQTPGGDIEPGGWNKGLTKHSDPRVAKAAAGISKAMRGNTNGRFNSHTPEYKAARSAEMRVRRATPEFKEKLSAAVAIRQQIPWNTGLTAADERVAKGLAKRRARHGY